MRATRELRSPLPVELRSPLPVVLALAAGALFFGGGSGDGSLPWLGLAAGIAALVLFAAYGPPAGLERLVPLALLAVWCAVSIEWSIQPDRSWSYANRIGVYLLFALVGALAAGRTPWLAEGFAALFGAVCIWSLAGKVFPWLYDDYGRLARLRGPIGYWNALALVGAIAIPFAFWLATRRREAGVLLAYGWIVAIGLTYSRGGAAVAVVGAIAWIALSRAWTDAIATIVAAALPAGCVLGVAFVLHGVTSDGESHATRVHDGLLFGAVLVVGAAVAVALARLPRPEPTAALRTTALALAAVILLVGIGFGAVHARSWWNTFTSPVQTQLPNTPGRFVATGSNHRWVWWKEAWRGFETDKAKGTGAGTFDLVNLRYRQTSVDDALEPHDLPVQFLGETGIIGFVLLCAAAGALLAGARARIGPELAAALALPLYLLHSLVDIDWDFAAVTGPVLLLAGAVAARPGVRRRPSYFAVLATSGALVVVVGSLFSVWLASRWTGDAQAQLGAPKRAITLAQRARQLNPLAVDPLFWQAFAQQELAVGKRKHLHLNFALGLYQKATKLQPDNWETWFYLGEFNFRVRRCAHAGWRDLNRAYTLNSQYAPVGTETAAALKIVNVKGLDPC